MSSRVRRRTPEELAASARQTLHLLSGALNRFDSGDKSAIHDAAVRTRTVLSLSPGDRLILRLVNEFSLQEPTVSIPPVAGKISRVITQIGPIPCEVDEAESTVPFSKWVKSRALLLPGGIKMQWEEFVRVVANDEATHVSEHVRTELENIRLFYGPSGTMDTFLQRAAGAVAERCLSFVLNQLDSEIPVSARPYQTGPVLVRTHRIGVDGDFVMDMNVIDDVEGAIAMVPASGRLYVIELVRDPAKGTLHVRFSPFERVSDEDEARGRMQCGQ